MWLQWLQKFDKIFGCNTHITNVLCVGWLTRKSACHLSGINTADTKYRAILKSGALYPVLLQVQWLIRHGARLLQDRYGCSPLQDAEENQQKEVAALLADLETRNKYRNIKQNSDSLQPCSCPSDSSVTLKVYFQLYHKIKKPFF